MESKTGKSARADRPSEAKMEQIGIESLGQNVGRIGFGCSPLGEHGWGPVDRREMTYAIHLALDQGINLFDISDVYGLGRAEESLGNALVEKRQKAVIVGKFGVRVEQPRGTFYDTSPRWIESALDNSLRRLRTDTIDIYMMHYWDERTPIDDVFDCLEKVRSAGKIRAYGFTNVNPSALFEKASSAAASNATAFGLQYNLLDRHFEGLILRAIKKHKLTFLSWGSLAEGLLTGKFGYPLSLPPDDRRRRYRNFVGDRFTENLRLLDTIKRVAASINQSLSAVALRWILDQIPRSVALVGMKSRANVQSALDSSGWLLSGEAKLQLDSLTKSRKREDVAGLQYKNSAGIEFATDLG